MEVRRSYIINVFLTCCLSCKVSRKYGQGLLLSVTNAVFGAPGAPDRCMCKYTV